MAVKRIRCISSVDAAVVGGWPAVTGAEHHQGRLHVITDSAEAVVRRLLDADPHLSELEVQRAGLAEAFTELTREAAEASLVAPREVA